MTLKQGTAYKARVHLAGLETFATNAMIVDKLWEAGFRDVAVIGTGGRRTATGKWGGATQEVEIPHQLKDVEEWKP